MGYTACPAMEKSPPTILLEAGRQDISMAQGQDALELNIIIGRVQKRVHQVMCGRYPLPQDLMTLTYAFDAAANAAHVIADTASAALRHAFPVKGESGQSGSRVASHDANGERISPATVDEATFNRLVDQWRSETGALSSSTAIVLSRPYQRILTMGKAALPFILKDLEENYGHWFWALEVITEENPVPPEFNGNISKMREIWLEYGRRHNLIK